jgi:hypothetical protein
MWIWQRQRLMQHRWMERMGLHTVMMMVDMAMKVEGQGHHHQCSEGEYKQPYSQYPFNPIQAVVDLSASCWQHPGIVVIDGRHSYHF